VPTSRTARSPYLWLFFSLKGRISRQVYWLAYLFLLCVEVIMVIHLDTPEEVRAHPLIAVLSLPVGVVTIYSNIAIATKRLHDGAHWGALSLTPIVLSVLALIAVALGYSAPLLPIMIASLAFTIWVGVLPGTTGANRFGEAADVPPPP
jgi:uncharacterized membrane protein YhaH (DUF805 family)